MEGASYNIQTILKSLTGFDYFDIFLYIRHQVGLPIYCDTSDWLTIYTFHPRATSPDLLYILTKFREGSYLKGRVKGSV